MMNEKGAMNPDGPNPDLPLGDIFRYAAAVEQFLAVIKSLRGASVGTVQQMPTVKTWIGDAYWEADLGTWKRLK
jgi:hypothetical protein